MSEEKLKGLIPKEILIPQIIAGLAGRKPDLCTAMLIASNAFFGHKDKSGAPYVEHLSQILVSGSKSQTKKIIGLFHDLLEDTVWTAEDLRAVGFKEEIITAVTYLTHEEGESYFESIERLGLSALDETLSSPHLAIDVKLADLNHNLSGSRNTKVLPHNDPTPKSDAYIVSYNYLVAIKKGKIKPGTSVREYIETIAPEIVPDLAQREAILKKYGTSSAERPVAAMTAKAEITGPNGRK